MTGFGYNINGFGISGEAGPPFASQVFTSSGTYTPTEGVSSALFMVFGARGQQIGSGHVASAGGGGGYAEKYVSSLSSSYSVTLNSASTSSAGGASVVSSPNFSRSPGYGSSGDFTASGGAGGVGSDYNVNARGGTAAGGSRCGGGGSGGNSNGSTAGSTGAIGNGGNEVSGVFDLSPYGITFAYTRFSSYYGASGVPVFTSTGEPWEDTLVSNLSSAAHLYVSQTNAGVPGWAYSGGEKGSVVILEFF